MEQHTLRSESVSLVAENGNGCNGTRGMMVSGGKSSSDGASSSKGFYLEGGIKYDYSVWVFSETDETFHFTLNCKDAETDEETIKTLACHDVKGGKWTKLSGSYSAPKNSYEFRLDISTDSTNDFRFDDVLVTAQKTGNSVYATSTEKGLKDEFANYFRVGNILNGGTVKNSAITANIIKDFNSIECENEFKPDATLNQSQCSGTNVAVKLDSAAAIMDFCVQNNISHERSYICMAQSDSGVVFQGKL